MKLKKIILIVLLFFACSNAQFKWNAAASYGSGYESNIFKSPAQLSDNGQMIDTIKSDMFLLGELDLDLKYSFGKKQRIRLKYDVNDYRFKNNTLLNQYHHQAALQYIIKFSRHFKFITRARIVHAKKRGTDMLGDGLTRIFNYNNYDISPQISINPRGKYTLDMQYIVKYKNYTETAGQQSIDYRQNEYNFSTRYYFNKYIRNRFLTLDFSYSHRQYINNTTRDAGGLTAPSYPARSWRLYKAKVGYLFKLSKFRWGVYSRFRYRDDPFESYYSYRDYKISTRIKGSLFKGTLIKLNFGWKSRYYLQKEAAQENGISNEYPKLNWKNIEVDAEVKQKLYKGLSLKINYELDRRDTNVTDMLWRTNRDYLDQVVYGSLVVEL